MTPNLTVGYMAEQINRGRLDGMAARSWLADQGAATGPSAMEPARLQAILGAARVRLGERLRGTAHPPGTLADPAALPTR